MLLDNNIQIIYHFTRKHAYIVLVVGVQVVLRSLDILWHIAAYCGRRSTPQRAARSRRERGFLRYRCVGRVPSECSLF